MQEAARDAGRKLFAAKLLQVSGKMQLGIIPVALASGALLAAAGGLYVWYQTRPQPPVAYPPPVAQAAAHPAPAPAATQPPAPVTPAVSQPLPAAPIALADDAPALEPLRPEPRIHIESHPETNSIDPVLAAAYQAYRQGDYATAQQQYAAALKQDPQNRDALLGSAAIAQQQGQDAVAAQYYEQVLTLDPRDPVAYAGMAALSQDDSPEAESRLKLLLAQQPQAGTLYFALGNHYVRQQRWPEAQQAYFDAYRLQPDNAVFAYNLAVSLDHLGQRTGAAQYYQRALQLETAGDADFDRKQTQQRLEALRSH